MTKVMALEGFDRHVMTAQGLVVFALMYAFLLM